MKPVCGERMCAVLVARGWTFRRAKGSHFIHERGGPVESISVPVHGNRDLKPGTQRAIMRQAGLTDDDL